MHNTSETGTVNSPQLNPASPILPEGYQLRDYKIIKMLGRGGFGITYLAQEVITDKLVVIKENYPTEVSFRDMTSLTVGPATDSQQESYNWALTRFLDEAKTLSGLSHPNIVPIRYAFKALGTAYYVMPHVEGTELHKAAPAPDSITAEWLLPVLKKILSALDYLHGQGLIHRDIKPNNILMRPDGEPILIDFGTARALESTHSHTHIGTPGFMPFEQLSSNGKRGPWTDFYALGATCYRLITGKVPPHSIDRMEEDEYQPLAGSAELLKRFPEHVLSSIDKALRMNIDERWQSAQEWLKALKDKPTSPAHETSPNEETKPDAAQLLAEKYLKSAEKETRIWIIIIILLLAALSCGGYFYYNHRSNPLYSAVYHQDAEKVRLLLDSGADVNKVDKNGNSPLIVAILKGNVECGRLLLAVPEIDINLANKNGETPLYWAVYMGKTSFVRLLLAEPGINVNKQDKDGETPLYWAAYKGNEDNVRLLLAMPGINVNTANKNGETPLYWAAQRGHTECVRLLLAVPGINVNKANMDGITPLQAAEQCEHTECAELIRAAGGI